MCSQSDSATLLYTTSISCTALLKDSTELANRTETAVVCIYHLAPAGGYEKRSVTRSQQAKECCPQAACGRYAGGTGGRENSRRQRGRHRDAESGPDRQTNRATEEPRDHASKADRRSAACFTGLSHQDWVSGVLTALRQFPIVDNESRRWSLAALTPRLRRLTGLPAFVNCPRVRLFIGSTYTTPLSS